MKGGHLLIASAAMHGALALLFVLSLMWWPGYAGRPLTSGIVGLAFFLGSYCAFLGFALLKARGGSSLWGKMFGIGGGIFLGTLTGFGGWKLGLVFGVPLVIGIAGLWRRGQLRSQNGAAKRE